MNSCLKSCDIVLGSTYIAGFGPLHGKKRCDVKIRRVWEGEL